jgi:tetratricopeptide (TPR) repeat protein
MASLLPGYKYDIFISYRQKDNKGDRWVTGFVDALKTEIEAAFKEDISIYFDENPHDGLLETHDVDRSLEDKLKCLLFIPVISRTYCDQKSFAWNHEFIAFIEQASGDRFGLKVQLPVGNVGSRVLPVRIHDLDPADIKLCESVLGGALRGIDFVYKESGVNRPLTPQDDEKKNLNGTKYRNQLNKTANAIREIITGLRSESEATTGEKISQLKPPEEFSPDDKQKKSVERTAFSKKSSRKLVMVLLLLLFIAGAIGIYKFVNPVPSAKTVAVIPFTNPGNDYALGSFSIGAMDAIISKLQEVKNLTVRSRFSSLQYLDTKKPLAKIRNELNINYLVDISIEGTKDNLKMWVGLTKTRRNKQLWAKQYNVDEKQLMQLFTEIVQTITGKLNVVFSPEEGRNIQQDLTGNPEAYVNYLRGNARLFTAMGNKYIDSASFVSAIKMYDKAIEYDPAFAVAYARRALARSWGYYTGQLDSLHIQKCWSDIITAEKIDKGLTDVQIAYGFYYYYCKSDFINALISFHTASILDPQNYQPLFYMALVYRRMGEWEKSQSLIHRVITFNPQEALYLTNIGLSYTYLHNFDSALIFHQKAIDINPEWSAPYANKIQTLILRYGNTYEAHAVLDSAIRRTLESLRDYKILLNIYDGRYNDALNEILKPGSADFFSKADRYLYTADLYNLLNKPDFARDYYDSALVVLNIKVSADSTNSFLHGFLGLANAGKGNAAAAVSEGMKAIKMAVADKNKMDESDMIYNLAVIYSMLGRYDDAFRKIEFLLENPSALSVKLLQVDPGWKPLLIRPEFKTILRKYPVN